MGGGLLQEREQGLSRQAGEVDPEALMQVRPLVAELLLQRPRIRLACAFGIKGGECKPQRRLLHVPLELRHIRQKVMDTNGTGYVVHAFHGDSAEPHPLHKDREGNETPSSEVALV